MSGKIKHQFKQNHTNKLKRGSWNLFYSWIGDKGRGENHTSSGKLKTLKLDLVVVVTPSVCFFSFLKGVNDKSYMSDVDFHIFKLG